MDDSELWVPLVQPRVDGDDEELLLPFGPREEPSSQVSSEVGLAGASDSLAPASPSVGDTSDDVPFPTRRLMFSTTRVPDFTRIPRERREEAMRTVPEQLRLRAVQGLALPLDELAELGMLAMSDLPPAPSDVALAQVRAKPQPAPTPAAGMLVRNGVRRVIEEANRRGG